MQNTVNPATNQMNLQSGGEWFGAGTVWSGTEVFQTTKRRSDEWLSDCSTERALTTSLMDRVAELSNLARACQQVISNNGSPGVDGMTVVELSEWFGENWRSLQASLLNSTYYPAEVLGVEIPKPQGGYRQLGIPTVKDRLIQQALHQVLSPRYERIFSKHSFGFRPGRSAHDALSLGCAYVRSGKDYIVDIDLAKFFDEVNHDRLMWLLGTRIGDKRVLRLIGRFLKSGMLRDGLSSQRLKGTPQGGPLSPLLSNIVLDELDKELERRSHCFVRYSDDLIIHVSSEESGHRVLSGISTYIESRLRLKVNQAKSGVRRCHGVNFLGHRFLLDGRLGLSRNSEGRFKNRVREITRRNRGISLDRVVEELNTYLVGWLNYFIHCRMRKKLLNLMGWIRRKIRCYRLKQCKRSKSMVRFLAQLGVPPRRGWLTAGMRKDWWRKSDTPASHEGMNLNWFAQIGLANLVSIYDVKHPKKPPYTRVRTVV